MSQPDNSPSGLPSLIDLKTKYAVYPCQPLVCAASIVQLFPSLKDATERTKHGWWACESSASPGAGNQNSKACSCMTRYLSHGDMDQLIQDLHDQWGRTVLHQDPFKDSYERGMILSREIEPALRRALEEWLP